MSNIDYTLWPNANGTLGQNKIQIPDGGTTTWPTGDAIVGNFVYNKGSLVGFVDTKALIANSSKTSTLPYDYVNITLPSITKEEMTFTRGERCKYASVTYSNGETEEMFKYKGCKTSDDVNSVDSNYHRDVVSGVWVEPLKDLENGRYMFNYNSYFSEFTSDLSSLTNGEGMFSWCSNLTTFTSNMSSLTYAVGMFGGCPSLTTFNADMSSLTDGGSMFGGCYNLTSFTSNMSSLTDGSYMFGGCYNLTSFDADLSSLTNGQGMFNYCYELTAFSSNLSSLTNGQSMFYCCPKLRKFDANLSSLKYGSGMFYNCSLSEFTSDLSSLTDGSYMFDGCQLNTASVKNIADTINRHNGTLSIGLGRSSATAEEESYFQQIRDKGWSVYVHYNGSNGSNGSYDDGYGGYTNYAATAALASSVNSTDEMTSEMFAPIPFWAKPFNATEETARYVDSEGNFYNILGGNLIYVDDPDTYGMFTCLDDAAANMRLTKIQK